MPDARDPRSGDSKDAQAEGHRGHENRDPERRFEQDVHISDLSAAACRVRAPGCFLERLQFVLAQDVAFDEAADQLFDRTMAQPIDQLPDRPGRPDCPALRPRGR